MSDISPGRPINSDHPINPINPVSRVSRISDEFCARLRAALETADLAAFGELLAEDVRWGAPGDPNPTCQSRRQVLDWYQRGPSAGVSAQVTETTVLGDQVLVGLVVRGSPAARERGGQALRWQLYQVRGGQVVDLVGFEERSEAVSYAQARGERSTA